MKIPVDQSTFTRICGEVNRRAVRTAGLAFLRGLAPRRRDREGVRPLPAEAGGDDLLDMPGVGEEILVEGIWVTGEDGRASMHAHRGFPRPGRRDFNRHERVLILGFMRDSSDPKKELGLVYFTVSAAILTSVALTVFLPA